MLVVKNVSNTIIDVFTGNGWDNWHRFEVSRQHGKFHLKLVKGKPMTKEDFKTLYESFK